LNVPTKDISRQVRSSVYGTDAFVVHPGDCAAAKIVDYRCSFVVPALSALSARRIPRPPEL